MEYDYAEIGKVLKKRREELQKKLSDIAEDIKISESYLEAIEEERLDLLPSMVFYNLFVRSYAKELELDPEQLLEDSATPEAELGVNGAEGAEGEDEEKKSARGWWFGLLAVIVIAVAAILFFFPGNDKPGEMTAGQYSDSAGWGDSLADSLAGADSIEVEIILPDPLNLRIIATDLCWVLVISDDDTALNGNLDPNSVKNFQAYYDFKISLGNPSGVQMALDGVLLKPLSESGGPVRDVLISRENMATFHLFPAKEEPEEEAIEGDQADSSSI